MDVDGLNRGYIIKTHRLHVFFSIAVCKKGILSHSNAIGSKRELI